MQLAGPGPATHRVHGLDARKRRPSSIQHTTAGSCQITRVYWSGGALTSGLAHTDQPELLFALIKHQLAAMPPEEQHIDIPRHCVTPEAPPRLLLWCQQLLLSSILMAIRAVATLAGLQELLEGSRCTQLFCALSVIFARHCKQVVSCESQRARHVHRKGRGRGGGQLECAAPLSLPHTRCLLCAKLNSMAIRRTPLCVAANEVGTPSRACRSA
jgi:hypothetical protein